MIVTSFEDRLRLVTQNDHAAFSGELLSLWRADGLPEHPRRAAILGAGREHDNGWLETDSAPHAREDGRPHDFRSLPGPLRRELWRRGTGRWVDDRPGVALLVLEHALALHSTPEEEADPEWAPLLETWRETRRDLLERLGIEATESRADYRFVELADLLSLAVCAGWNRAFERRGLRFEPRSTDELSAELRVDPLPLAGATTFEVACRFIEDRAYEGDADLALALASARWRKLTIRVRAF